MSKNLQNSLDDLLESIFETKEFKKYKQAEKNWKEAKESQSLLNEFLKERGSLDIYREGGFERNEKQEKKFKELHEKVQNDKEVNRWVQEQKDFQEFIFKQTEYLSKKLQFPFTKKPSCGGGCC